MATRRANQGTGFVVGFLPRYLVSRPLDSRTVLLPPRCASLAASGLCLRSSCHECDKSIPNSFLIRIFGAAVEIH